MLGVVQGPLGSLPRAGLVQRELIDAHLNGNTAVRTAVQLTCDDVSGPCTTGRMGSRTSVQALLVEIVLKALLIAVA
ncbi:hypothetical protein V2A60_005555 [Cordyceps javanica]